MKQSIICPIKDGRLTKEAADALLAFIKANNDKYVDIKLRAYKRKRSSPQNRYYFGVVVPAVYAALIERGEIVSPDDVHTYLKAKIGGFMVRVPDEWVVQSSTELSTQEWSDWMEKIWAWGALNGIAIPQPNEDFYESLDKSNTPHSCNTVST